MTILTIAAAAAPLVTKKYAGRRPLETLYGYGAVASDSLWTLLLLVRHLILRYLRGYGLKTQVLRIPRHCRMLVVILMDKADLGLQLSYYQFRNDGPTLVLDYDAP